jgi:SAM-dependent methyltransferase
VSVTSWLDHNIYPSFADNWDDSLMRQKILDYLRPDTRVLDLGAGAGIVPQMNFSGLAGRLCGIDPNAIVLDNPHLDERKVGSGESIPFEDATFDLVFANNVLEHLPEPHGVFREVHRVLKPGGMFVIKTPNQFHYVVIVARMAPFRLHKWVNRLRGRSESDTYPTKYRANSSAALRRLAGSTGFKVVEMNFIEGRPEYLRLFWPAYLLGALYERLVNSVSLFSRFSVVIVAVFAKEARQQGCAVATAERE